MRQERLVRDLAGDAGDVVVAEEGLRRRRPGERRVAAEGVGQLPHVGVDQAAPGRLPQLVLGDRVQPGRLGDRGVVAVDDLAEEPAARPRGTGGVGHVPQERRRDGVGGVQAPRGDAGAGPPLERAEHEVPHGRLVGGRGRRARRAPRRCRSRARCPGPAQPSSGQVSRNHDAYGEDGPCASTSWKAGCSRPDVVEHPVQGHGDAALPRRRDQVREVVGVAQARVDPQVVDGVVAVAGAGEDGAEQQPVGPERDDVVEPALQARQPVDDRGAVGQRLGLRPEEAERVQVPPQPRRAPGGAGRAAHAQPPAGTRAVSRT